MPGVIDDGLRIQLCVQRYQTAEGTAHIEKGLENLQVCIDDALALLRNAGWQVNDKRVERLWKREGLKVPRKQPKKGRL